MKQKKSYTFNLARSFDSSRISNEEIDTHWQRLVRSFIGESLSTLPNNADIQFMKQELTKRDPTFPFNEQRPSITKKMRLLVYVSPTNNNFKDPVKRLGYDD